MNSLITLSISACLKPINDVLIFNILRRHEAFLGNTHSCNLRKPWCFRCPKCAYVLLNYYAYLSTTAVDEVISEKGLNIFDLEENQLTFRELAGLEDKKPFECVGQFEEAKLAFILCKIKGLTGKAIDKVTEQLSPEELDHIVSTFTSIEREDILIPEQILETLGTCFSQTPTGRQELYYRFACLSSNRRHRLTNRAKLSVFLGFKNHFWPDCPRLPERQFVVVHQWLLPESGS